MTPEIVATKAPGIVDALVAQGPMGILVLVCLGIMARIYLDMKAERAAHVASLEARDKQILALALEGAKREGETVAIMARVMKQFDKAGA